MTVQAGLGSAVTPALPVVNVEVKLEVDHLSVKLDESVGMIVHRPVKAERCVWSEGREEDVVGDWDGEE
jgi:hypothetical protein